MVLKEVAIHYTILSQLLRILLMEYICDNSSFWIGDFNVEEHIEADDAITIARKMSTTIFFALEVMIIGWHILI